MSSVSLRTLRLRTLRLWWCGLLLIGVSLAVRPLPVVSAELGTGASLTIDQITAIVIQHNTDLLAAIRQREAAAASVSTARAFPNPRIEVSSGDNVQRPLSTAASGRVEVRGVSQLIENPFLRSARVSGASAGSEAAGQELQLVRNNLVAEVRTKAFELLLRLEEELAAKESVRLLEQIRDRVRLRVDWGGTAI